MEVAEGPRLRCLRRFRIFQFRLVDRRAAQEARAVVSVPADHLEREARLFAAVLGEHEEEPRGIVEPGPVEPAHAQLLHVGGAEIVPLDGREHLLDLVREVAGRQPVVGEKAHWNESVPWSGSANSGSMTYAGPAARGGVTPEADRVSGARSTGQPAEDQASPPRAFALQQSQE